MQLMKSRRSPIFTRNAGLVFAIGCLLAAQPADETGVVLNDGAGVLNPAFEFWAEGAPLHWEVTGGREQYLARGDAGALDAGPGYGWVQVAQRIDADRALGGEAIRFTADVQAREKDTAKLVIRLADGSKFHSAWHSGSGKWETLEVSAQIPQTYVERFVYVTLYHYNTPKRAAHFRNPSVRAGAL